MLVAMASTVSTAEADPLKFSLTARVTAGEKPRLRLVAEEPLTDLSVALEPAAPEDGKAKPSGERGPISVRKPSLSSGQELIIPLGAGKPGATSWRGMIQCKSDGKLWKREATFETEVRTRLEIAFDPNYYSGHLDVDKRFVEVQLSAPAGRAEISVYADDGSDVGGGSVTFKGEPPGTWLRIPWQGRPPKNSDSVVLRLALKLFDADGNEGSIDLYPWAVTVPHEEVNFETNSAEIADAERGKLDASLGKIKVILDRVDGTLRSFAERGIVTTSPPSPKLYVAGHTDTVGGDAENLTLSRNRARALSLYFRERGFRFPIYYAGLGERQPRVRTPDNTDEARNRRADYTLAFGNPPITAGVSWDPLQSAAAKGSVKGSAKPRR